MTPTASRDHVARVLDSCFRETVAMLPRRIRYQHRPSGCVVSRQTTLDGSAWLAVTIDVPGGLFVLGAARQFVRVLPDAMTLAEWLNDLDRQTLDRMVAVDGLAHDRRTP